MGQLQSRDELLYKHAVKGNVQAIKALCTKGAGLEWIDEEGKTPLIVACMSSDLFIVAKTLVELGAIVNSCCPGRHAGTPLHHAAKRGLHQTVKLLLSHGANPLVRNDDCQTPLDVARVEGFIDVVRAIESHISFFSGWLWEFYGPGFLEALAHQLLSRKIWVVIVPCGPHDSTKPLKLELVIYPTLLDSMPRTVIALWKTHIEEPNFHQSDPALIIFDKYTKTRYRFASANDGDKQQLQWLFSACRGIPQVTPPLILQNNTQTSATQSAEEAVQLSMTISASIQSSVEHRYPLPSHNHHQVSEANNANGWGNATDDSSHNGWGPSGGPTPSEASISGWIDERATEERDDSTHNGWGPHDDPAIEEYNGWGMPESRPAYSSSNQYTQKPDNVLPVVQTSIELPPIVSSVPSAPPVPEEDLEGPAGKNEARDESMASSCVICWEGPVEGACIPCGHMAVCMPCLNEIKSKQGACPVCRATIDQVVRIYAI